MNEIIIEGRLAQNPEKKQAKTGTTMTTFNVASDRMMDKGNIALFPLYLIWADSRLCAAVWSYRNGNYCYRRVSA